MRILIAAMLFATVSAMVQGASFKSITYSTGGDVVPGRWTSQFQAAKSKAKANDAPLVAVWVSPSCGYCTGLGSALGSSVTAWAAKRGYYLVIGVMDTTSEAAAVKSFAYNSSGLFPYVGVWWPKKTGDEVKERFSGRPNTMPVKSGTLAQKFMDSVDNYVGAYAGVPPKYSDVAFDARGGTMAAADRTRTVATGKSVGKLPTATRSGYELVGWFTAATGGEMISSSTVVAQKVTYYAQWAKVYALSVACNPSDGGKVTGAGSFAVGASFAMKASAASGYVLSGWYSGQRCLSQETTYKGEMGAANLSLKAVFIRKKDDTVSIDPVDAAVEYEKKREIVPIAISAKGGSLPAISVAKLPSGLRFTAKAISGHAANTIYGTPTKSGIYAAQVTAKTAGGAKATMPLPLVVRADGERIVAVECDQKAGKVSGGGVFADGRKASVRATALKDQCFTGWKIDGELVSRSTSYSHLVGGRDVTLVAEFASKADDLASVRLALDGKTLSAALVPTNVVRCGVSTNWTVVANALSGTTVSASGLPSGMKLVKTLVDKDLKEYSYEIAGTPTSASRVDSRTKAVKPSVVTVKVSTLGRSAVSYKVAVIVEALPTWSFGTFDGFAAADEHGRGVGAATMTVSSGGKVSGKFSLFGTNWTYSATGYAGFESAKAPTRFAFAGVARYAKLVRPIVLEVVPGSGNCSLATGGGDDFDVVMHRKIWSDRPTPDSPKLAKTELAPPDGFSRLAVSVSSGGKATFSGKLENGTSVSASSTVFVDADGVRRACLIVPASRKCDGYFDILELD